MKENLLAILQVSAIAAGTSHATVLYSDLFNNGGQTGAFDGSTTPEVNLLGPAFALQSYGIAQQNKVDRLHFQQTAAIGGVRFGADGARFNWATGTVGSEIASGGGLHISFDMRTGNGGDYIAFGFGMDGNDPTSTAGFGTVYADDSADWGIRFENDRMISFQGGTTTPIYRTDTSDGGANAYNFGNFNVFHVDLFLELNAANFNAGSTVTASVILDNKAGTVITIDDFDTWTLQGTDDFIWDIAGHQNSGSEVLMYDLSVSSIPEPGTALLGGIGLLALLRRRRRAC